MMQDHITTAVSVILPAYNEEDAVRQQVEAIQRVLGAAGIKYEIIVVDDGSQDRTSTQALQAHARVLRHRENRGYGASLKAGIHAAKYNTIVIIDADKTYPADQIPFLVDILGSADMAVGARTGKYVHIPFIRRPGKWLVGWLANRIAGQRIPDLNSGLRAFRRECVAQYFSILPSGFSFTTTITLALLADGYRIVYHPIDYYRRVGRSKITPRHFMDFTILVLRMAMLFQPLKIFVPLAFSCGALGVAKVVYDVITLFPRASGFSWSLLYQPVLSTSAILLLLAGLQLLLIGMVADGVLRRIGQQNGPLAPSHAVWVCEAQTGRGSETEDMIVGAKK